MKSWRTFNVQNAERPAPTKLTKRLAAAAAHTLISFCFLATATGSQGEEVDVLLRAVGFALTGNDNVAPEAIDRANCVFMIGNDTFYLNNVHTDRITFEQWKQGVAFGGSIFVKVRVHGDKPVIERKDEAAKDNNEVTHALKLSRPDLFQSHTYKYNEIDIDLKTSDQNRITRAWAYIYAHGCSGQKSPF